MTDRHPAKPTRGDQHLGELLHAVSNLNDRLGDLQRGIRTLGGAQLMGARAVPILNSGGTAAVNVSQAIASSAGRLFGWMLRGDPTNNRALHANLRDGRDVNGDVIGGIVVGDFSAGGFAWFGAPGIGFANGLFLEVVQAGGAGLPFVGAIIIGPAAPLT